MDTNMIISIPTHGSSQPLLSLYTIKYQETIMDQPCRLLFYEFYGTEETITYIPNGCIDFLIQEQKSQGIFLQPFLSYETINCLPGSRYFGIRFPTGMLPSRHFQAEYFTDGILRLATFEERITWFSQAFQPKQQTMAVSDPVHYILEQICLSNGTISIHKLSETLNYSERHIHRLFLGHMGFSPKHYSRIIRFQSALFEMLNAPEKNNSDFIKCLGYSDQAHFQREFKEFTSLTPRQFINLYLISTLRA